MNKLTNRKNIIAVFTLSALLLLANSAAFGQRFSAWAAPVNLGPAINTSALEGCPFIAPDNLSLFFASDRAGGAGGTDIWFSTRANANAMWGMPVNLGTNINSSSNDFCPTLMPGGLTLYFVSNKPGGCGLGDIYVSQRPSLSSEWGPAVNLGCQVNSPQADITPSLFTDASGTTRLYFSSNRPGGPGMTDIYVSTLQPDGTFGTPALVAELNTPFNDQRPNLRVSDGLEIFFESDRTGTLGLSDLHVSTRASASSPWQVPVNLGATVNSASFDSRPSLSFDGRDLYFHSPRPGGSGSDDIYVVRRTAWSVPQNLGATVNTANFDANSTISPNGLSLYFSSNRPGGFGATDIWVSQRATLTSAWGAPQNLGATVNSSSGEGATSFSLDGRTMFIHSDRPGGLGSFDLYLSTRTDPNDDFGWSAPVHLGAVVNSASSELGPAYFEDPTTGNAALIFASTRPGGLGGNDLYQSTRNTDGTFNAPVPITELNSSANDIRSSITRDGLEIYITTDRPGGQGLLDIFVSTRASTTALWNPPIPVADVNTAASDASPTLSADGATMYFNSNRAGGFGDMDLYSTTRTATSSDTCTPSTTVSEGDLFPGGIASFGVTSGFGSVTVDHVNGGTGLQSLTVVGTPTNATVNIPAFTPGTFTPVTVTFTTPLPGQAVDFTLRAASTFHAAFIRIRCRESCTPATTVTEGDLAPGGIVSFGVSSGAGSVTIDHVNAGTGLQSLTVVGTPTNAVVNIPPFTPGTTAPVTVTFSIIDPTQPIDFTLRAASTFHAANIRARCVTIQMREPEK